MSRERPGPSRADWADPRRLAALAHELHHAPGHPGAHPGAAADLRRRDHAGRVLSALKVTIRLRGTATVRHFDTWNQLASYLSSDDFTTIAPAIRSITIAHRPDLGRS
jgi:hypothetical protein